MSDGVGDCLMGRFLGEGEVLPVIVGWSVLGGSAGVLVGPGISLLSFANASELALVSDRQAGRGVGHEVPSGTWV